MVLYKLCVYGVNLRSPTLTMNNSLRCHLQFHKSAITVAAEEYNHVTHYKFYRRVLAVRKVPDLLWKTNNKDTSALIKQLPCWQRDAIRPTSFTYFKRF